MGAHALLWCCVLSVLISLRVSLQLDDTRVRAPRVCVHAPRARRARATATAAADCALPFFSSSFSVALRNKTRRLVVLTWPWRAGRAAFWASGGFFVCASWCFMGFHGAPWCAMVRHGASWCLMVLHGSHGGSWCFMAFHGVSWCSWFVMVLHGAHGASWVSRV